MTAHVLSAELSNIIHEAKRKNPDLRNAAEKALTDLKALPSTSEAQLSGDLQRRPHFLTPLLTACKSGNSKLCLPAVTCLQRLIVSGGLPKERLSEVLESFQECSKLGHDIQLKILQCLPTLLQSYAHLLEGELQSSVLYLCISLQQSKTAVVSNTASATLQQAVSFAFEKVETEDENAKDIAASAELDTDEGRVRVRTAAHDAFMVLEDLCLLTEGQRPRFMRNTTLSQAFGLEIIETVLTNHGDLFDSHKEQAHLLRNRVMPLVTRFLSERLSFPVTVRTFRIFCMLLQRHLPTVETGCEIPLGLLNHILDTETSNPWRRALCMETFKVIYSTPNLALNLYALFDEREERKNIIQENLATNVRLATERPALIGIGPQSSIPTGFGNTKLAPHDQAMLEAGGVAGIITGELAVPEVNAPGISTHWSSMKPCLDQPEKSEPPSIPETYIYSLVLTCINNLSDGLARVVLPLTSHERQETRTRKSHSPREAPSTPEPDMDIEKDREKYTADVTLESRRLRSVPINPLANKGPNTSSAVYTVTSIVNQCWPAVLATSSTFLYAALDGEFYRGLIRSLQKFTQVAGLLRLSTPRDALLTTLAKAAVPPGIIKSDTVSPPSSAVSSPKIGSSSSALTSTESFFNQGSQDSTAKNRRDSLDSGTPSLSQRNLMCLRALVNLGIALGSILEGAWPILLETLQKAEGILAQTGTVASARDYRQGSITNQSGDSSAIQPSLSSEIAAVESAASRLFQSTHDYPNDSFKALLQAFCALLSDRLPPADMEGRPQMKLQRRKTSLSGMTFPRHKLFAISKLGEIARYNIQRLAHDAEEGGWKLVVDQLLDITTNFREDNATRLMAADVFANLSVGVAATTASESIVVRTEVQRRSLFTLHEEIRLLYENLSAEQLSPSGTDLDIHRSALDAVRAILDECGDSLVAGWQAIFSSITSVFRPPGRINIDGTHHEHIGNTQQQARSQGWSPSAKTARSGFGSIQFICSDFLNLIREDRLPALIDLLSSFSSQKADLNISLTTITLFWNVSDFLQSRIPQPVESTTNGHNDSKLSNSDSERKQSCLATWMNLQKTLASLVDDPRADVRNGAVQTAYRILDNSENIFGAIWRSCLHEVIFRIMEIDIGVHNEVDGEVHDKTLAVTSRLILKGFGDVFGTHLDVFWQLSQADVENTWQRILDNFTAYLDLEIHDITTAVFDCISQIFATFEENNRLSMNSIIKVAALWARSLPEDRSSGFTSEKTLVAYTASFKQIYRLTASVLEPSQIQDITNVFRRAVVLAKPGPYSSDVDSTTALQDQVLECIGQLQASQPGVSSILASSLAQLAILPYQERPGPPSLSFIALSKKSMGLLQALITEHAHDLDMYENGTLGDILGHLSECIRYKYRWQQQGKEPSMWRCASSAAVAIVQKCLPIFRETNLKDEHSDSIAAKIVQIAARVADAELAGIPSNDTLISDETFDLTAIRGLIAALSSVKVDINDQPKPAFFIEDPSVSTSTRNAYILSLFGSSLMHESMSSIDTDSPLSNLHTIRPGSTYDPPFNLRVRMCYFCFDQLFFLVASPNARDSTASTSPKLANAAFPYLVLRCALPLKRYIADQPLRGRMPTPMSQRLELLYVLQKVKDLKCMEGIETGAPPTGSAFSEGKKHLEWLMPLVNRAVAQTSGDEEIARALRRVLDVAFGGGDA